jgi:hypothetical protein
MHGTVRRADPNSDYRALNKLAGLLCAPLGSAYRDLMRRRAFRVAMAVLTAVAVSALALPVYGGEAFVECVEILAPEGSAGRSRSLRF